MLECSCHIISYLADVMNALRQSNGQGTSALLMEGEEKAMEVDSDWVEELAVDEDDSQAEDSVRSHPFMSEMGPCFVNIKYTMLALAKISSLIAAIKEHFLYPDARSSAYFPLVIFKKVFRLGHSQWNFIKTKHQHHVCFIHQSLSSPLSKFWQPKKP